MAGRRVVVTKEVYVEPRGRRLGGLIGAAARGIGAVVQDTARAVGNLSISVKISGYFQQGNIIQFYGKTSGTALRVVDHSGRVDGHGGAGLKAQFQVHQRGPGIYAFQNMKFPQYYLAIKNGQLTTGGGGPFCDFRIFENDQHYIIAESVKHPSQHMGVLPGGHLKPPHETGRGDHGQFSVVLIYDGCGTTTYYESPPIMIQSVYQPPPVIGPSPVRVHTEVHSAVTLPAPSSAVIGHFSQGAIIQLYAKTYGRALRIRDGRVDAFGGHGQKAQFIVHERGHGIVALQNVKNPASWLAIRNGELTTGGGGKFCDLRVIEHSNYYVTLESVCHPNQHVGVLPTGQTKPPANTGRGDHSQFVVRVVRYGHSRAAPQTHVMSYSTTQTSYPVGHHPPPSQPYQQQVPKAPPAYNPGMPPQAGVYPPQPGSYPPPPGGYHPGQYPPSGGYPPTGYPPAGAYPPGQYPPGQYPPGQYPPGQYPPGQYPPPGGYSDLPPKY